MDQWKKTILKKVLDRSSERKEVFKTESDILVKRLYTPVDLEGMDYNSELGFPGEYPYTRRAYPSMYMVQLKYG